MKRYRDLRIFKDSRDLAIKIHNMTLTLPRNEWFEEGSQIRRSSKAICSLIVEGYARRRYKAEFIKYLVYAHSECEETIVHLDFLHETGSMKNTELYLELHAAYRLLSKSLYRFIEWIELNLKPGTYNL